MKAKWRKAAFDGALRLRIGDKPALACVYRSGSAGWEWWSRGAIHVYREGRARTMREAKAAAEQAVRDELAEMTAATEVLRG